MVKSTVSMFISTYSGLCSLPCDESAFGTVELLEIAYRPMREKEEKYGNTVHAPVAWILVNDVVC